MSASQRGTSPCGLGGDDDSSGDGGASGDPFAVVGGLELEGLVNQMTQAARLATCEEVRRSGSRGPRTPDSDWRGRYLCCDF